MPQFILEGLAVYDLVASCAGCVLCTAGQGAHGRGSVTHVPRAQTSRIVCTNERSNRASNAGAQAGVSFDVRNSEHVMLIHGIRRQHKLGSLAKLQSYRLEQAARQSQHRQYSLGNAWLVSPRYLCFSVCRQVRDYLVYDMGLLQRGNCNLRLLQIQS